MFQGCYNHQRDLCNRDLGPGHPIDNRPRFHQHEDGNPRGGGAFFSDQGNRDFLRLRTENLLLPFVEGRGPGRLEDCCRISLYARRQVFDTESYLPSKAFLPVGR